MTKKKGILAVTALATAAVLSVVVDFEGEEYVYWHLHGRKGDGLVISWDVSADTAGQNPSGMSHYELHAWAVSEAGEEAILRVDHPEIQERASFELSNIWEDWGGDSVRFWVTAVDVSGNVSDPSMKQLVYLDTTTTAPPDTLAPNPPGGITCRVTIGDN